MNVLLLVTKFITISCLRVGKYSSGETERGAWQQNNQSKSLVTTKGGSLTMWKSMKVLLFAVIVVIGGLVAGCTKELVESDLQSPEAIPSPQVTTGDEQKTGELLAWEKARYDYSYLEDKVEEANQYLKTNKLNLEDLKQLHEIGNLLFGEYRSKLAKNWKTRTADFIENLIDRELFHSEYARREIYDLLYLDYSRIEEVDTAPNVRILTDHIGERGEYVFVTVKVYCPHFHGTDWGYTILQLKRNTHSKYGWMIYYDDQEVPGITDRGIGPWTVEINEQDDFSEQAWLKEQGIVTDEKWETYFTQTRPLSSIEQHSHKRVRSQRASKYNRQAAASYAYTYAHNYNSNYFSWKPWNIDCV